MFNKTIHAPIEKLDFDLFNQKQIEVFIKREDMIHPFIAGNKWRKLKYILQDARQNNKTELITFGGAYSNHLLAVACAGASLQFSTTGIVRGEQVSNHILALCQWFGMKLQFVDRESYKEKAKLFAHFQSIHQQAYFIDEGGSGNLGVKGCAEILENVPNNYDHIFCSVGTGSTLEGLIQYADENKLNTSIEGIAVLKGADFLNKQIENRKFSHAKWKIHHRYHEGGYAKTNEELLRFIQDFASKTGILIDQVYEGKMMKAIFTLAEENYFKPKTKILAIHNGGVLGLLGVL